MEQQKKTVFPNRNKFERVVVDDIEYNDFKRSNLLKNAECGLGKVKQVGRHLSYTVGNEVDGFIEYFILNASLTTNDK